MQQGMTAEQVFNECQKIIDKVVKMYNDLYVYACCLQTENDTLKSDKEKLESEVLTCYRELSEYKFAAIPPPTAGTIMETCVAQPPIEFPTIPLEIVTDFTKPKRKPRKKKEV